MPLTVEMNKAFVPDESTVIETPTRTILVAPLVNEDYWIARVVLYKDQAILAFPKFMTVGCGFAQEEDWNTNLPLGCPAEMIYRHIKKNKKYDEITDEACLEAIQALQAAVPHRKVKP